MSALLTKYEEFDASKFSFGKLKISVSRHTNTTIKSIDVSYDHPNQGLLFKTPLCKLPVTVAPYEGGDNYSLPLIMDETKGIEHAAFKTFLKKVEDAIYESCKANRSDWFGDLNDTEFEAAWPNLLRYNPKDETSAPLLNGFKLSIAPNQDQFNMYCHLMPERQRVTLTRANIGDVMYARSNVMAIVRLRSMMIVRKKLYPRFEVTHVLVHPSEGLGPNALLEEVGEAEAMDEEPMTPTEMVVAEETSQSATKKRKVAETKKATK